MSTTATTDIILASESVAIEAKVQRTPTVSILAYSGGLMNVPGLGPVVIDLAGLEIAAAQVPILADHESRLAGIVGHGAAEVRDHRLYVAGTIAEATPAARQVLDLARSGFAFQASVGVEPLETARAGAGESLTINGKSIKAPAAGLVLVKRGRLREVSITSVGCDPTTSVSIAASRRANMENSTPIVNEESIRAEERERIAHIEASCASFAKGPEATKAAELKARAIAGEITTSQLDAELLRLLRQSRPRIGAWSPPEVPDSKVIEAALLGKMGLSSLAETALGPAATERAHAMGAANLIDLARASLLADHQDVPRGRHELVRAALSSYSLPQALGNAANKVLLAAYTETPATWRPFCSRQSVPDFKTAKSIRPTFTGGLTEIGPDGEFKHASIKEALFEYQARTFGQMLSIDRRHIVDDDLSLFESTARALGRAAMRSLSDLVYATVLSNVGSFFSVGHGNYISGATTALSPDALAEAITAMRSQRNEENHDLDIAPRVLLVPPSLETTAKALLQSEFIQRAADQPTGNALRNAVEVQVEPRLANTARFTGASDKHWYLLAGPADAPVITCFLNGLEAPTVEAFGLDHDVNRLAYAWRVYFDYGVSFGDWRAAVRSKGEA